MEFLLSHHIEFIGVSTALLAVGVAAAFYFCSTKKPKGSLDPECFKEFKLIKRTQISHNVAKFRFKLPTPESVLGLPTGQHMSCRGKDSEGDEVVKPYTPTSLDSDLGYFELVIKMYPQGRMSHHFREMCEGDFLSVKGPKGRFKYKRGTIRAFGMLAGGSGITPMFQVARAILEDPEDKTELHLIYANVKFEDILLKTVSDLEQTHHMGPGADPPHRTWNQFNLPTILMEELDKMAMNFSGRFTVYYVLNEPPEGWEGGLGFVTKEMIEAHCPPPAPDIQILRCGPLPMNKAMAVHLDALAYSPSMLFQF